MDSAIGFAKEAICCVFDLLSRQIDHLRRLGDDVRQLEDLLKDLNATKMDISNWLEREGREASAVVRNWIEKVDNNAEIVADIRRDYDLHKRCVFGCCCCPDRVFMLRLSSTARDRIPILQRLSEDGREFLNRLEGSVTTRPAAVLVPVAELVGQTPRRAQAVIQHWLAHHTARIIGIHGLGGVGKTSLAENINNDPHLNLRFHVVFFVTASQNADIRTLQNSIAGRLGLTLPERAEDRRIRLFNYLQKKRYLLILDDLWENVDLHTLGVGEPSTQSGSRIVFTTRDRRICLRMGADRIYELQTLSQQEAWELFRREARLGDRRTPAPIEAIAKDLGAHRAKDQSPASWIVVIQIRRISLRTCS